MPSDPATAETGAAEAGSSPDVAVELRGVSKTYGEGELAVHALSDVDLTIPRGELVVMLGPSGSGKTTLLNLIGGIETASAGEIVVGGCDLSALDEEGRTDFRRHTVGFIFQFFNLIPTLTALENVELVAELSGERSRERSAEMLAEGRPGRPARQLPRPALGRPAAAGGGGEGPHRRARGAARRRADRRA